MSDVRVSTRPYFIGPGSTFFVTPVSTSAPPGGFVFLVANGTRAGAVETTSASDTRGASLIVMEVAWLTINNVAVSDSNGNTWLPLVASGFIFDANRQYYCFNPVVSSNHTFTLAGTSAENVFGSICWAAFSGATANSTIDQALGSNGGNSLSPSASAITPSQDNELLIASCTFGSAGNVGTITAISEGFTIANKQDYSNNNCQGSGIAYLIQPTAATVDPVWTIDTQYDWTANISCFRIN